MSRAAESSAPRGRVRVHRSFASAAAPAEAPPARARDEAPAPPVRLGSVGRVGSLDVAAFASALRAMVAAGLPVCESLGVIARGNRRRVPALARALEDVKDRVEQGRKLGEAFAAHRELFGDLCVELIAAGEQTGRLEEHLGDVAEAYEERHRNRATVVSALIEPALIVLVGIAVVYLILTTTVPRMRDLYDALARSTVLPLPTRVLMAVAEAATSPAGIAVAFGIVIVGVATVVAVRRVRALRYRVHSGLLRLPLFSELVRKDAVARGSRTLGVVVKSVGDVPLGLEMASRTCGNLRVGAGFEAAAESVRRGRAIWTSLEETGEFPEMCVWMVRTGERTGTLDTMLPKLAEGYETEVKFARERLLTLMRPALVVVMGAIVLGIMLAVYMPVFTLIEQMKR